jgi:hypothetical protein
MGVRRRMLRIKQEGSRECDGWGYEREERKREFDGNGI